MKTTRTALKWAGLIVAVPIALLLAVNARDETPDPRVKDFGAVSGAAAVERENAYFAQLGFEVPLDQDPHARGVEMAARHEAALRQNPYALKLGTLDSTGAQALSGDPNVKNLICGGTEDGCRQQRERKTDDLRTRLDTHQAMVARYERFYVYPQYRETLTATISSPLPSLAAVAAAHQLVLAKAVLSARGGDPDQALAILERDARFWRLLLRDADSLITKMVAARRIAENAYLLSELLSTEKPGAPATQTAQAILLPLTREERDLGPALRREFRMAQHMITGFAQDREFRRHMLNAPNPGPLAFIDDDILYPLFFQPNATLNRIYRDFAGDAAVAGLPAAEFFRQLPAAGAAAAPGPIQWDLIYNPVGKLMIEAGRPDFRRYAARLHNLDGLLRLVALQLEAKRRGVAPGRMEDFLRDAGAALANPYSGAPMQYDAQARRLYFLGVDNALTPTRRIEVPL